MVVYYLLKLESSKSWFVTNPICNKCLHALLPPSTPNFTNQDASMIAFLPLMPKKDGSIIKEILLLIQKYIKYLNINL
jgi:hypothetical protein